MWASSAHTQTGGLGTRDTGRWEEARGSADARVRAAEDELFSGDNTVDLLIEDQLLRPSGRAGEAVRKPSPVGWPPTPSSDPTTAAPTTLPLSPAASVGPTPDPNTVSPPPPTPGTTSAPSGLPEEGTPQLPTASASAVAPTATESLPVATNHVPSPAAATTAQSPWDTGTSPEPGTGSSLGPPEQASTPATPVSPTIPATPKQALEEEDIRNIIGECSCAWPRGQARALAAHPWVWSLVGDAGLFWGTKLHLFTLEPTALPSPVRGWRGVMPAALPPAW